MSHIMIAASQLERALVEACRRTHADVLAFMVAPRRCSVGDPWDGHDWLIEVPAGTFHRWRLHVPRMHANRAVAEGLLALAAAGPVPLIAVGP